MTEPTNEEAPRRLHAVVYGRVQGVNFRATTQQAAAQLGLTGWVMNRWDGAVETVAEGSPPALRSFERFLQRGPRAAEVERVESDIGPATGEFRSFNIRW